MQSKRIMSAIMSLILSSSFVFSNFTDGSIYLTASADADATVNVLMNHYDTLEQALIDSYNSFNYDGYNADNSDKELSEEELKAKLEAYGTISVWEYHDYDGNGTNEAYGVITTSSSADPSGELYEKIQYVLFINSDGEITEIHEKNPDFLDYVVGTAKFSSCSDGQGFFTMARYRFL